MSSPTRAGWLSDFAWRDGRIYIRKTGVSLSITRALLNEVGHWLVYLVILAPVAIVARLGRSRPLAIWYAPDQPRPWYLVRGAALWVGGRVAAKPELADAAVYFDDVTTAEPPPPTTTGLPAFNFRCADISKSHVAAVFERVFDYPLTVDPRSTIGPLVEKPEKNGVHGGRIVHGPLKPLDGHTYQRLIETADEKDRCRDLRTICVGGEPTLVWLKLKPPARRFAIDNLKAELREPRDIYSPEELTLISRFTVEMGLDWGGLDILRDRHDGRIYVVDVNKTDVGPVIALSLVDKIRSMARLGRALERMIIAASPAFLPAVGGRPTPTPTVRSARPSLPVLAVVFAAGVATPTAVAAPNESALAPVFGSAIVSTHPDGRQARLWLHRDHSYAAQGRKGERSGGTWSLSKSGKLCLRQKRPAPIPIAYCRALPPVDAGKSWRAKAFNGDAVVNEIVPGG